MTQPAKLRLWVGLVWGATLICLAGVTAKNVALQAEVKKLRGQVRSAFEVDLGQVPADIYVTDRVGEEATIPLESIPDRTTLILVASSGCGFCKATMDDWRDLESLLPAEVDVLPLGLDPGLVPSEDNGTPLAFLFDNPETQWLSPSEVTMANFRLRFVPQTIVVRHGQILLVKTGPLDSEDIQEIRRLSVS